ncbi:ABC transporter substrate-binding protein [Pseudotabrizicola alkalilacus]|nr:extracellular solute-binding protein [Pseudotabrizicola alkalilacus]
MKFGRRTTTFMLTAALALGTTALSGLSSQLAAQERTLKVWFGRDQFIPEDQFAQFKAENPDIAVEFEVIRLEDVSAQLVLATRSGNAPDIVQIQARDITQLAQGGMLKEFDAQIETFKEQFPDTYNQLSPIAWEGASSADGKLYGVALFVQSIYLTYRKDLLEAAGIAMPLETTDNVLAAAKAVSTIPGGGDMLGFSLIGCCVAPTWELPLFLAMGGQFIDGVPQIDTEVGIEWIEFYQTLMRDKSASPDSASWDSGQMRAAFVGGRAGVMHEGEHIYVEIEKTMPYAEGKWTFERLPTRPGQTEPHVQSGFAFPFVVTTAADDDDAVVRALEYLARPDFAKQVAIRYQPTTNSAVSNDPEYLAAKPWAQDIAPLAASLVSLPTHPTRVIQIYDVLTQLRDRSVADTTTPAADLAKEYQDLVNKAAGL